MGSREGGPWDATWLQGRPCPWSIFKIIPNQVSSSRSRSLLPGRLSKGNQAPLEAKRTASKCPLERHKASKPRISRHLSTSGFWEEFFVVVFCFSFFSFLFLLFFLLFLFSGLHGQAMLVTFLTPQLEERKISRLGPT